MIKIEYLLVYNIYEWYNIIRKQKLLGVCRISIERRLDSMKTKNFIIKFLKQVTIILFLLIILIIVIKK